MTMAKKKNISLPDDEFRVIGARPADEEKPSGTGKRTLWWLLAAVAACIALACLLLIPVKRTRTVERGVFETGTPAPAAKPAPVPFDVPADSLGAGVEVVDTVINDVQLSLYIPHGTEPVLCVGNPTEELRRGLLAFQAADIRADNRKILGAFVLKGEPLAWGLSKKGYCAIIDGKVTVGVSENSPLFEEATEKGGYFFRQYPLVDNGVLCESELKGKSMRKGLCSRAGQVFVAVSETDESMHDFAQALVDLGVENAIYLVGSHYSFGWCRPDRDNAPALFGEDVHTAKYRNETYIIWP